MSCPTCDHTCQIIAPCIAWCPRCGTWFDERLKLKGQTVVATPKLVERCRRFVELTAKSSGGPGLDAGLWRSLGIAESIHPPERPEHTEEELKGGTE